ncbi:hypothetical protein MPH_12524 [Macrophomina phaseolina MS6]|uniref:Uncharacterized protein n=1 Tax=Macrophomina phaseolina (strain MS6) TaxID=1126212 RepID=K2S124_MACPH|nr:hypothetical protein MPH_12524 [Macrophomina phaseolina MS6]
MLSEAMVLSLRCRISTRRSSVPISNMLLLERASTGDPSTLGSSPTAYRSLEAASLASGLGVFSLAVRASRHLFSGIALFNDKYGLGMDQIVRYQVMSAKLSAFVNRTHPTGRFDKWHCGQCDYQRERRPLQEFKGRPEQLRYRNIQQSTE